MWTCDNCNNQSEDNYRFCWSCGKPKEEKSVNTAISFSMQTEDEPKSNIPQVKTIEKADKIIAEDKVENKKTEPEIEIIEPIKPEPEKKPEPKPNVSKQIEKPKTKISEPELFTTFLPESERRNFSVETETDWETIIFTTAVRLVGLYFVFLFLTSIPDFVGVLYNFLTGQNPAITSLAEFFATPLFSLLAKMLFYLILGIYLIAGGRILLWFLPRK